MRRSRRLVISSVATVENYEYGYFWYFYQDGNIQFEVKLTGILSLGAAKEGDSPKYGTMIAPHLYAPNHQHFFNVRMDFALDGIQNSVAEVDVVMESPDEKNNPYQNAFYTSAKVAKTEMEACSSMKLETMRSWKILNPNVKNSTGSTLECFFDLQYLFGLTLLNQARWHTSSSPETTVCHLLLQRLSGANVPVLWTTTFG